MSPRPAIIDTNVVGAGLIGRSARSPVVRIFDGMIAAKFAFVLSDALLQEYGGVLLRPKLTKAHGLSTDEIDTILGEIAVHAIVLTPAQSFAASPDLGDQHLWDLLASHDDVVLVTGDSLLLASGPMQARVLTPQAFVDSWTM